MARALKIKAKKPGFRRAGFSFDDAAERIIPLSDLTQEQIDALKAEPNLLVSEIDDNGGKKSATATDDAADAAEAKAKAEAEAAAKAKADKEAADKAKAAAANTQKPAGKK